MSVIFTWSFVLLLACGDIHPNPGPVGHLTSVSSSSSSISDSVSNTDMYNFLNLPHNLSVVHYNVQSLLNKVDTLFAELNCFDVISFSETWLNPCVDISEVAFERFHKPERKDRSSDKHGGVIVYVRETLSYIRRHDLEINGLESIWIELRLPQRKNVLFGVFYRPPNSDTVYNSMLLDSIGLAVDTGILDIVICGDFNYNTRSSISNKKVSLICQQFQLKQCINDITHVTETSSSTIDLLFVKKYRVSHTFWDR